MYLTFQSKSKVKDKITRFTEVETQMSTAYEKMLSLVLREIQNKTTVRMNFISVKLTQTFCVVG